MPKTPRSRPGPTSSDVRPPHAISKSCTRHAPFMATAARRPRSIRSTMMRPEPDLDGMRAHAEDDRLAAPDRRRDALGRVAEVARAQDVGQPAEERAHRSCRRGSACRGAARRPCSGAGRAGRCGRATDRAAPRASARPHRALTSRPGACRAAAARPARRGTWPIRMCVSWMRQESVLAETQQAHVDAGPRARRRPAGEPDASACRAAARPRRHAARSATCRSSRSRSRRRRRGRAPRTWRAKTSS